MGGIYFFSPFLSINLTIVNLLHLNYFKMVNPRWRTFQQTSPSEKLHSRYLTDAAVYVDSLNPYLFLIFIK